MNDLRKAAQMALEVMEDDHRYALRDKAIDALRAALAQPEQEPLTDEEIVAVLIASAGMTVKANDVDLRFARAIEAAHGIGNE